MAFLPFLPFLPWTIFTRIVDHYGGNLRFHTLPCTEHFRILAFAQLTYRESLRDIEACPWTVITEAWLNALKILVISFIEKRGDLDDMKNLVSPAFYYRRHDKIARLRYTS